MYSRENTLAWLTSHGTSAALFPVLDVINSNGTDYEHTKAAVRAALDELEKQGFITFVPAADWPESFVLGPRQREAS